MYGAPAKYSYWKGCSTGGRQAMKEIQVFPNDFDGVIEEVNEEKRKLKVMVKIFGRRTPLELNYNQIQKL